MKKSKNQASYIPRHAKAEPGAEVMMTRQADGGVTVNFSDGSDDLRVSRREFMRISGVAAAAAAVAGTGCDAMRNPVEKIVPYVDRPEDIRIGKFNTYATVWNHMGVLVKTRVGRPVKLEGNPSHPTSLGALSARAQSSYMKLYDPDRAHTPLNVKGDSYEVTSFEELDLAVINSLKEAGTNGKIGILTASMSGSAQQGLINTIGKKFPNLKHYTYEAISDESILEANMASYGERAMPHYRFDKADMIISLQSDFLGDWFSSVEFTKQFSSRRNPEGNFNRMVAFEGMMTLTGANADERFRVRTSDLTYIAMALAHEVIVTKKVSTFAGSLGAVLGKFTPALVSARTGVPEADLKRIGQELAGHVNKALVVAGGVASSTPEGVRLEAAVNLLNAALGADGHTIERDLVSRQSLGEFRQLKQLVDDLNAGKISTLIIGQTNPVYSAPPELGLAEALKKATLVISCQDRLDETAVLADYLATSSHYLESWGDALPFDGIYSIQQPVIRPLYETRPFEESLLVWFAQSGLVPELAPFLTKDEKPVGNQAGNVVFETGSWYRFVRNHWEKEIYPKANAVNGFDAFWEAVLRKGVWISPEAKRKAPAFNLANTKALLPQSIDQASAVKGIELVMFSSIPMGDGDHANNGHLQELPDPITKHVWGSYLMLSPKRMDEAGVKNGDYVEIRPEGGERGLQFPVIMVPGMHDDVVAIPLGYGRTRAGEVANELGENGFMFSSISKDFGTKVLAGFAVSMEKSNKHEPLAVPQGSQLLDMHKRSNLMAITTLSDYQKDASAGIHAHPPLQDFWEDHKYSLKWGMSVDLSKCTGCNACVIACQEENNTAVVGRQGVIEGREMHWMRIDRYYRLPQTTEIDHKRSDPINDPMFAEEPYVEMREYLDNPRVVFQPIMCQHCENAPCETVCPVLATMHSTDGLNQMAYNRCVGTRYCSNNCPFKVRRFNWYNYSEDRSDTFFASIYPELKKHGRYNAAEPLAMGYNPEVTVRSRGVMEKCTFCVQRIRRAKWDAKKEGRTTMRDGDVITACQQSCPADAITFGNLTDPESAVSKMHAKQRAMTPLHEIGVESSVAYLTRVVNTEKIDLRDEEGFGHHGAGHGDDHGHDDHGAADAHGAKDEHKEAATGGDHH